MKRFFFLSLLITAMTSCLSAADNTASQPKHEFRGAWMHIIGQNQYAKMNPEQTRDYLVKQLDLLQRANCNAVIWQIRPQADAAYKSDLEPCSRSFFCFNFQGLFDCGKLSLFELNVDYGT